MSADDASDVTTEAPPPQVDERLDALTDEMAEVKARTEADGLVTGTVRSIRKAAAGTQYRVEVDPPFGDPVTRSFIIPKTWTDEYAFKRWVEGYGYTAENFSRMVADDAGVHVDVDDGQLVVPDPPEPRVDTGRIKGLVGFLTTLMCFFGPVVAWVVLAVTSNLSPEGGAAGIVLSAVVGVLLGMVSLYTFIDLLGWMDDPADADGDGGEP